MEFILKDHIEFFKGYINHFDSLWNGREQKDHFGRSY
jgi:hypothetical protein